MRSIGRRRKLREKVGESLSTIQKYDTPIEQATTPSLEALKAYSLGRKARTAKRKHRSHSVLQTGHRTRPQFCGGLRQPGNLVLQSRRNRPGQLRTSERHMTCVTG